jgi:hypothetical protein
MYKALLVSLTLLAFAFYYQFRYISSTAHTDPIKQVDNMSISRQVIKRVLAVEQAEVCSYTLDSPYAFRLKYREGSRGSSSTVYRLGRFKEPVAFLDVRVRRWKGWNDVHLLVPQARSFHCRQRCWIP